MERITVTVTNWAKYNPRTYKKPTWFAFSNDLLDHPDLATFSPLEFHVLLYIFCQASKRNSATIDLVFAHAKQRGINKDLLSKTISKLVEVQMVSTSVITHVQNLADSGRKIPDLYATDRQTRQTDRQEQLFDFESAYESYPRKLGKKLGMARLRKRIKTQEDLESFERACRKYARQCKLERTDVKYIKHFSSFVGSEESEPWLDFAAPDAIAAVFVESPPPPEPEIILTPEERAENQRKLNRLLGKVGA